MIKELEFRDIPAVIHWLRQKPQRDRFQITEQEALHADMNHWRAVMGQCLASNCSFISMEGSSVTGAALGLKIPLVWSPNRIEMYLMMVQADNNITATKMFLKWHKTAMATPGLNRILVDKLPETNLDYAKLGYSKLRETYYKEV